MKNLIKCLIKKRKNSMSEFKKGDRIKLKLVDNYGKLPKSGNGNINNKYSCSEYVIICPHTGTNGNYKAYMIEDQGGTNAGWVYEHEISSYKKEHIVKEIVELQSRIDCLTSKLEWMVDMGVDEYDEDEFKVYETLKTLENGELDIKDKTKLIASLIKGNNC